MAAPLKHGGMTIREIAAVERTTPAAIDYLLSRALRKLRKAGLLKTARELAQELEAHRNTQHSLSRPRSARKAGAQ